MLPTHTNETGLEENRSVIEARALGSLGISGGEPHYAWTVRGMESALQESTAVLDLGCGVGHFGSFLKERFGQRPHGMDVVRHTGFHEECYESFELRDLQTMADTGKKFDFIFVIGLIEYFPNPRAFFRSVTQLMNPGASLVMTAPNPASLLNLISLAARGEYSTFRESSNPSSITPVLAVDVQRMLREAGLTTKTVEYSDRGRIPFLRGLQYQQVLPFLRGRLWSDNFRCVAQLGSE
jgi:2-polyprenyl-3-methyl-5-hydroxy-6-metoxy-1,4-benzoquinol methylase